MPTCFTEVNTWKKAFVTPPTSGKLFLFASRACFFASFFFCLISFLNCFGERFLPAVSEGEISDCGIGFTPGTAAGTAALSFLFFPVDFPPPLLPPPPLLGSAGAGLGLMFCSFGLYTARRNFDLSYSSSKCSSPFRFFVLPLLNVLPRLLASNDAACQLYLTL